VVLLAAVVLKNPKDIFLSHSLSLPNTRSGKSFKGGERVACARLCRRNAQRERERERRVRVTQSDDDDDAKLFFLSFFWGGCCCVKEEKERKKILLKP